MKVLYVLGLAAAVEGQVLTGTILGTVKDPSGAVVSGASVTVQSPALIGGFWTKKTDGRGQFRFPSLAPGVYSLEVELAGFKGHREENLQVLVGGTVERSFVLPLAAIAESLTVSTDGLMGDARKTGLSTNYPSEYVDNTPVRRLSVFDLMKSAPGMSATSPSGGDGDISAFGSAINENAYLMDGTNYTSPISGFPFAELDTDIVQEIEIVSLGASAEYGNVQGAVFNVVTKQGGNSWRFDGSYYNMSQALTSQPILLDCMCPDGKTGYTRDQYHDFTAHLGGPLLRDRMWVFGGYQYQRDSYNQPGSDPRFPAKRSIDRLFGKLTWQATPRLKLTHTFHDDYWEIPGSASPAFPIETLVTVGGHRFSGTFANLTHVLNETTLWDARVSGSVAPNTFTRPNGGYSLPFHFDLATGTATGGSFGFGSRRQRRFEVASKLTRYADDFLGAAHEFKFGIQFVDGFHRGFYGYPGGAIYYDYAGEPYFAYFREPYSSGGEFQNVGAFVEDLVRLGDRLTVNVGFRLDWTSAISPDVPAVDSEGNETGETIRGLGTFYTWNVFSPRLGFSLKLTADAKTLLRGTWGRYYGGVLTGEFDYLHPGLTPITAAYYDPATGLYSNVVAVIDDARDVRIDPETKTPHTDQFTLGLEREIRRNLAAGLTFIKKDGRNFTGWRDIGGVYGEATVTLDDGRPLPVYPLLNSTSERVFLLTNPEGWFLDYKGLLLTLSKRWSRRWQALVSYSVSEARGLVASSGGGAGGSQFSSGAFAFFGRDPNHLTDATGNLPNDRTHMLRVQGAFEIPKVAVLVGTSFQQLSGKPWAGVANVRLPQGTRQIYVEPRGARRLPAQSLLDLRISKILRFGKDRKLELLVDILNALNETAPENVVSRNVFSSNFAEGSSFVEPRRAMAGIKFVF